jgi:branched-chain amino acid aminotransferase
MKVWIDGEIVAGSEARLPVTDHGLLYGDGVFEGLRCYAGRVFRLGDHLQRFAVSARSIGLELPVDLGSIEKIVLETARAHGAEDGYLRLIATRGVGSLGVDPTTCSSPRLICIAADVTLFSKQKLEEGLDLVTVSVRRPALDALDPRVKSLNYLNNVLAKREARLRGADDGLILNAAGTVAEASVANVFAVRAGALSTPPATDGSLDGITRDSVFQLASRLGIDAREHTLSRLDLLRADEVFLTGTGARIVPVARLDGQPIGWDDALPGRRPVTRAILDAFRSFSLQNGTPF